MGLVSQKVPKGAFALAAEGMAILFMESPSKAENGWSVCQISYGKTMTRGNRYWWK